LISFFRDLSKNVPDNTTCQSSLQSAIKEVNMTAAHINEAVRAIEQRMEMFELEKQFKGGMFCSVFFFVP
jgi:hypothetical protein